MRSATVLVLCTLGVALAAVLTAAFVAGCAGVIPEVSRERLAGAPPPAGLTVLSPCVIVQERTDRMLFVGTAVASCDTWHQGYASIVVRHPRGVLVIDPGFGRAVASEVRRAPLLWQPIAGSGAGKQPLPVLLEQAGIPVEEVRYAAVTHAHWDHIGAIRDLPNARV
jgi:hypothetical protein